MKFLIDFFPLLFFYVGYKLWGVFAGTAILIGASAIQLGVLWMWQKRVTAQYWVAFLLILIFGGLTLYFHDVAFLKWKVSIINWIFGLAFLASCWIGQKSLFERMIPPGSLIPSAVARTLTQMWGLFMVLLGCLNAVVVHYASTAQWVDFKVFWMPALTLVFFGVQAVYLMKKLKRKP